MQEEHQDFKVVSLRSSSTIQQHQITLQTAFPQYPQPQIQRRSGLTRLLPLPSLERLPQNQRVIGHKAQRLLSGQAI
jgi:hypothetical protein